MTRVLLFWMAIAALGFATACAQLPSIDETVSASAHDESYPDFLTFDEIDAAPVVRQVDLGPIQNRIASLKSRTAPARGPVLPASVRSKMIRRLAVVRGQVLTESDRARLRSRM